MKHITSVLLAIFCGLFFSGCANEKDTTSTEINNTEGQILIFSKTEGWRHDSIEAGHVAITKLASTNNISVTSTEDASYFTTENLEKYDAVIFLNTTETVFNDNQRGAFKEYIQSGGGFAGIHSASDTEYDWPWYNKLVGAYFESHPNDPNVRDASLIVHDHDHPSTSMLPETWQRADEWYNFQDMNEDVNVLISLDTDSYEGSAHPGNHPVAWYHEYDGGRSFYTALGHTIESYSEELFLEHLWGGIKYAMGME